MQQDRVLRCDTNLTVIKDVFAQIEFMVRDKTVLNVGAAGGVESYLPDNRAQWLHTRLQSVATEALGLDIDSQSIAYAARLGVTILHEDCESMDLGRQFDVIVLSDVIEHLNAPGLAIPNLMRHLKPRGRLLITTPNPTALGNVARAVLGRGINMYYDHMTSFLPENILALCDRFGFRLEHVYMFSHTDRRSTRNLLRSRLQHWAGAISPRLHGSFLAEISTGSGR